MKLLGISCGRRNGNTEILVKEALMGAEELGIEVELLRMLDLEIENCLFCKECKVIKGGLAACVIKDDAAFVYDKLMESDGVILGAPIYGLTPPGYLKAIADRVIGGQADPSLHKDRKKTGGIDPVTGEKLYYDERALKPRVGGYISDGGASTLNWTSFGLPLLHFPAFPPNIRIVDQIQVLKAQPMPHLGMVVILDETIARARQLGRNVAKQMGKPDEKIKWAGDPGGICPVCHCNLLTVTDKNPVECPICGISGTLKIENGKISVDFSEEQIAHARLTTQGILDHTMEVLSVMKEQEPRAAEVPEKAKKYQSYLTPLKPPSKSKKSTAK